MSEFAPGIVITACVGREENLALVLKHIEHLRDPHDTLMDVCVIHDGPASQEMVDVAKHSGARFFPTTKRHEPGMEQPRNLGVRHLSSRCNAVWFVDSDVILEPGSLEALRERWEALELERVIACPYYEEMPPGRQEIAPEMRQDPRWPPPGFDDPRWNSLEAYSLNELNVGLGCFSGNLVWPIRDFMRVGGFWNDLHHGRCEDGELGVRAVAEGIPITMERRARGYHLWHHRNQELAIQRNQRDVPMLNQRHPWLQGLGVFMVDKDGKRFDQLCDRCGLLINTGAYWAHRNDCLAHLHSLEAQYGPC